MTTYDYKIGTLTSNLTNLETLGVNPPSGSDFNEFGTEATVVNGVTVGLGYPQAIWPFDILTQKMFNTLMGYLNYQDSAQVYIKTKLRSTDPSVYKVYRAIMHTPEARRNPCGGNTWVDIKFTFTHLVEMVGYT
jgi:hypothetical protein